MIQFCMIFKFIVAFVFFTYIFNVKLNAAEVRSVNDHVVISGVLDRGDVEKLKQILSDDPKLSKVVFEDSPGGSVFTALKFAEIIKMKKLDTVVKGKCYSACAYAFLAGKNRSFDSGSQLNGLLLHVGRVTDGDQISEYSGNDKLMSQLDGMTEGKLSESIKVLIRKSWGQFEGVLIVSKNYYLFKREEIMYCDGAQKSDASKCTRIDGVDIHKIGIFSN